MRPPTLSRIGPAEVVMSMGCCTSFSDPSRVNGERDLSIFSSRLR